MDQDDLLALRQFQRSSRELGYEAKLLLRSEDVALDMLTIPLGDDDGGEDPEEVLTVSIFPDGEELEGSRFVQFYFQYPFAIGLENRGSALQEVSAVNPLLPLGHFNLSPDASFIYFKYVLAFPEGLDVRARFLSDVLDMCVHAWQTYLKRFEAFT